MDMKHTLVPAAFVASLFLAAPAWSAGASDTSTNTKDRPAASSAQAASGQSQSGAENHTQGEVNEKCLREDPRKHQTDVACAKLKSKRHPKMTSQAHTGQAGTAGQ